MQNRTDRKSLETLLLNEAICASRLLLAQVPTIRATVTYEIAFEDLTGRSWDGAVSLKRHPCYLQTAREMQA